MTHPHVTDASRDDILDPGTITHPSRSEEAMDRPQVITRQALENPPAEQTTNLQRGQAFAHDGVWAGFAVFPGGASTGWHHHGDYATYGYITSGAMTVEFGPGGRELVEIGEGDFIYIPGHLSPPRVGRPRWRRRRRRPSRRGWCHRLQRRGTRPGNMTRDDGWSRPGRWLRPR
jgi:uncharacterized RmlC-like cupin family protein